MPVTSLSGRSFSSAGQSFSFAGRILFKTITVRCQPYSKPLPLIHGSQMSLLLPLLLGCFLLSLHSSVVATCSRLIQVPLLVLFNFSTVLSIANYRSYFSNNGLSHWVAVKNARAYKNARGNKTARVHKNTRR